MSKLGRLVIQGELEVWSDKHKKQKQRQVFLYETCFLLCKKKKDENAAANDTIVYHYKTEIKVINYAVCIDQSWFLVVVFTWYSYKCSAAKVPAAGCFTEISI